MSSAVPGESMRYGPSRSARRFCQTDERLKPSKPTDPSMTATKASRPGVGSGPARPESGVAHDEPAVALPERRDPREQAEVDGERLAVLDPRPAAVGGHPEPVDVAVERDRERQRARAGGIGVAELERGEAEEQERRRPDTESLRIGERRRPRPPEPRPDPGDAVREREPRVEDRPDVPEQHLHRDEAEPEDHVDEGRREVLRRGRLADERGQEDEREQPGRDSAEQSAQRRERSEALERRPAAAGRRRARSSWGCLQSAPSARNERTRTTAPPQKKSQSGTGRS